VSFWRDLSGNRRADPREELFFIHKSWVLEKTSFPALAEFSHIEDCTRGAARAVSKLGTKNRILTKWICLKSRSRLQHVLIIFLLCVSDYILKAAAARTVARPSADPAASEQSSTSIHQLVMRPPWTTCTEWRSTRRIVDVCRSIALRYLTSLIIIDAICTWACCVLLIHATLPVTQHLDRTATYSKPKLKTQTRPWKSWSNPNSLCNLSLPN
jgi:hypothetical protein